jgi:diguanylate cyclase (GGDEF)-like protein
VIWQALYGRTVDLALTVAAVAITLVLPIVLVGGEAYPVSGWRSAALSTMTYSLTAVTVQQLIRRVRDHESMLRAVIDLTRGMVESTGDVRARLCDGLLGIARADIIVLSEIDGTGQLRITASTDHGAARLGEAAPASWRQVLDGGDPLFATRTAHDAAPFRSVLHQPVLRAGTGYAIVTVGWSQPRHRPPPDARQAVALVAAEATITIERADLIERVTRLARHDELTGLANRRTWDEYLARELSRADRTGSTLCIALLDLDHFKWFNDEHGHLAGDRLLKSASAAWSSQVRPTDMLARWGGEEFALAMPETDLAGAAAVIERLRMHTPMDQTFSAGVTEAVDQDGMVVMQRADSALYLAKESGRDRVVAFDRSGRERVVSAAGT